ncbi:MAG: hypothetical protein ACJ8GK_07030 [Luteimonas sp.]
MPTQQDTRRDLDRQSAGLPPQQADKHGPDAERDASAQPQGVDTDRLEAGGDRLEADATRKQQLGADEDGDIEQPDG